MCFYIFFDLTHLEARAELIIGIAAKKIALELKLLQFIIETYYFGIKKLKLIKKDKNGLEF